MDVSKLTVREIMQTDVVTVRADMNVAELVDLLEKEGISGAPVTGPDGKVEGVVSVTDVSRAVGEQAATGTAPSRRREAPAAKRKDPPGYYRYSGGPPGWLPPGLPRSELGARAVRDIMTPATLTVRPSATIRELCRFLDRGGIHRALVFEDNRLVGLVTSMDVVRAVAESGDG